MVATAPALLAISHLTFLTGFLASIINTKPPPLRLPSERLEAKPCRESPKIGNPSCRLFFSLSRRLSPLSPSSPRRLSSFSLFAAPPSILSLSPRAAASGGGGRVESRISTLTSLAFHLRSRFRLRGWWGVWENAAAVAFKNSRLRIKAPVRLSHAESWREGAVIHYKGYGLRPRNRMPSVPGQAAPQERSMKRGGMVRLSCVGPRVLG
ncbi:hypothetical protein F2Q69_00049573 [Brassica cretica]|uniref:Uncharacterized protein n=1 Tax=Brassica cretica TaxID=69181 RepID=A0A8S9PVW2_BRACR|nr:hypothetical protein F2Q69_00049573 [Brassica cretica]